MEYPIRNRLKEYLKSINISEGAFETKCGLSSGYVSGIKSGVGSSTIGKIQSAFPDLNTSWLLTGQGDKLNSKTTSNNAKPLHEVQYPIEPGESPFIDMGNGQYTMLVPLVDEYAYGSFPAGFKDPEYVEDLKKISITVDKQHRGKYFAFEIIGDSMENYESKESAKKSIAEGSIVVGREIQRSHWKSRLHYHNWAAFVVIHKEYGIACKTILNQDVEDGVIHLGSFNSDKTKHKDFAWSLDDIQAIFNVVRIINEP